MLVPGDGGRTRALTLPGWTRGAFRGFLSCALWLSGLLGWELQAQFGLHGSHAVQLAALSDRNERWMFYQRFAPEIEESERVARLHKAALVRAAALGLGDRRAASMLWAGEVEPQWADEARRGPIGNGSLMWPVREGSYGRGFGSGAGGYHLAMDIEGPRGAEVLAAAPGVVGYAGSELRGYGKLAILVHPGGRVTLYGHNQRLLVVPGEHVLRGQPIAELGSTGRSQGPHVHFELIADGRNCDPLPLFGADVPGVPAWLPPVQPALWAMGQARPKSVRCARRSDHPHPRPELDESKPDDAKGPVEADDEAGEPLLSLSGSASPSLGASL